MKFEKSSLSLLAKALEKMESGFAHLPDITPEAPDEEMEQILMHVAARMQDNFPYPHPLYAGQMLKPPAPIARLAYMLALWLNPNNHALDGGRASSAMEKEAVSQIAAMFKWKQHLGHLCSGGTMANLEALWIAGLEAGNGLIVASEQSHYTHQRISAVLKLPFRTVSCDNRGRMDLGALEEIAQNEKISTVVATLGTTGTGAVDPLKGILEISKKYGFRVHADAAYGGYFTLVKNLDEDARVEFDHLAFVDSIVIDPHKHGLLPYGAGCILFRDPAVGKYYKHDSPYTYFTSDDMHLGEISLECSRPGAAAIALWATQQMYPLKSGGRFAVDLEKSRAAALKLFRRLDKDERFITLFPPQLDIVIWAPAAASTSKISQLSKKFFEDAAKKDLHLAVFDLNTQMVREHLDDIVIDSDNITLLRSCLMKKEHGEWLDHIWILIDQTAG